MRALVIAALLAACGRGPVQQPESHAFCNSTCWNNAQCTGITACEKCVGGVCSGTLPIAKAP